MADLKKRLDNNVAGSFYVDSTCINCDTCRQLAPVSFSEDGDHSFVSRQPGSPAEVLQCYQALLACPVGSIGTIDSQPGQLRAAKESFPMPIEGPVYYCGFASGKSFGASSYFIRHPDGNWLIDSPRYMNPLVQWFARMGGIRYIFLTHEDDVADAGRYASRFGATRIIHRDDRHAEPEAEWVIEGEGPEEVIPGFLIIPTPGHTRGSMVLLGDGRYLFSGDHLWWDREEEALGAPRVLVWSANDLVRSIESLLAFSFEWLLPGHGDRIKLSKERMREELRRLLASRNGDLVEKR